MNLFTQDYREPDGYKYAFAVTLESGERLVLHMGQAEFDNLSSNILDILIGTPLPPKSK